MLNESSKASMMFLQKTLMNNLVFYFMLIYL